MKISLLLLLAAGIAAGSTSAQTESPPLSNELLFFTQHSGFTDPRRSAHRVYTAEYYVTASPELKLFGAVSLSRRFDQNDRSAGLGAYYLPERGQTIYGFLAFGFSPTVIPRTDLTLEYTRLLSLRLAGSIGYRTASFAGETVHMLIPGMTLYQLDRWTFTPKVFLARLASDPAMHATFLLHTSFDASQTFIPEFYYAVGSESYRVETLDYISSQHSWGITVGAKIRFSDRLALRVHYQHTVRIGAFQENGVDAALSLLW